jgi:coproporphyrinogen III oxidase
LTPRKAAGGAAARLRGIAFPARCPAVTEPTPNFDTVRDWLRGLQDRICRGLEEEDGQGRFAEDAWTRAEGGGGRSRVMKEGAVFDRPAWASPR